MKNKNKKLFGNDCWKTLNLKNDIKYCAGSLCFKLMLL